RQMHDSAESEEQVRDLRKCTYAGRPFGDQTFLEEVEARFGRKWRRAKQERTAIAAKVA
ncbi:MAG: hypothetical protein RL328_371, partial [Acidobacteriota bacterium]